MRLRGIDFGYALNASGARGFCGEGYWFHRIWSRLGLDYRGAAFVCKTLTLGYRAGNMTLRGLTPDEVFPKAIVVRPIKGLVLNAVGLSNPGAAVVLRQWAEHPETLPVGPKLLSFMTVGSSPGARLSEVLGFVTLVRSYLPAGHVTRENGLAIQVNLSCPNTPLDDANMLRESREALDTFSRLDVPLLVKVGAHQAPGVIREIADHPACDGVVCSNSIPWGLLPDLIDWRKLFGRIDSPLAHLGGGGLSGAPLLPVVSAWVKSLRRTGFRKPIVGGGGILSRDDVTRVLESGADAIEVGSASILRPWRVRGIIHRAIEVKSDA